MWFTYIDLTGTQLRNSLFSLLEVTFRQANLSFRGGAVFERYKVELSREELIRVFENHEIRRVRVRDLLNATVPPQFKFFNPDFDADQFLKAVIDEDLKNTSETEWSGNNIQETKVARGLVHTGNPTLVEGIDNEGFVREWTPSAPQSIEVELDTDDIYLPEEDLRKLLDYLLRTYGLFSERLRQFIQRKDMGDLPLFEGQQE